MRRQWSAILLTSLLFIIPLQTWGWDSSPPHAPFSEEEPEEVFLTFNYQNLFNKVVIALYDDGEFYLPVSDILSSLKIPHKVSVSPPVISGSYLEAKNTFQLNFSDFNARLESKGAVSFTADQMLIRETDFYVKPKIFQEVFNLTFSVDFNNLLLQLETENELPVVKEHKRAQERNRQDRFSLREDFYELEFDRDRKIFTGGFLDYSLSASINQEDNLYTYNTRLGTEVLGGDLQGSAFGSYSANRSNFVTDNLRWRYAWRDNNAISKVQVGQSASNGLFSRRFLGISISNEPIEPRYVFDEIEIEGNAQPGSEVELYFNDALYDYTEINQNGRYRFLAPLTYGSSRLNLKIYDPAGGVREISRRIQVPFSFLQPGELNYNLNAGQLENPIFGSTERGNIAQGDVTYGLANWLTQKVGFEYLDQFPDQAPLIYGSTSARLFKEYLLNVDVAPNSFYRISTNAIYSSSGSWDLSYSYFSDSGIYNSFNSEQEISGNIYLPFNIFGLSTNIRLLGNHIIQENSQRRTRYNIDLNTRLDRLNLRFRYSDLQSGDFNLRPSSSSEFSTAATYYVGRSSSLPSILEGTFFRGQLRYNPNLSDFIQSDLQISRNIFESGRLQASFSRNFRGEFNLFSLGLTIDLKGTRTSSTVRSSRNGPSATQNILGSIGYDRNTANAIFSNRQQVGRAATAVRLYVDENNSGSYDSGEQIIKNNAVRIGRSGVANMDDSGIIYLSQLQAYNRMNLEINQSAIKNPMLVPKIDNFSIVTDPNQYKPINIPFYTSGVISGKVIEKQRGETRPLSGLRVYLKAKDDSFIEEMQTFNDGTFYAYEIPPGSYHLYIDRKQLTFLGAESQPDTMNVEIESLAEGDFVEGLDFTVTPKPDEPSSPDITAPKAMQKSSTKERISDQEYFYQIQLASFYSRKKAKQMAVEAANRLGGSFSVVQNSKNGMFTIRSLPYSNQEEATESIISFYNSSYKSAALVTVNNSKKSDLDDRKFIQIGAFSTKERAEKFANQSVEKLKYETAITYHTESELYKVYLNEHFSNEEELKNQVNSVQSIYSYENAFINKHNQIQIAAFKNKKSAKDYSRISANILDVKTDLSFDAQDQLYRVFIDESLSDAADKKNMLTRIRSTRSPYQNAFVSVFDSVQDQSNLPTVREMDFRYQIQIKNITNESTETSISSILNRYPDVKLKHTEEEMVIIDNISSWKQAQYLQQKLSKVSSIGHPLIILVEK